MLPWHPGLPVRQGRQGAGSSGLAADGAGNQGGQTLLSQVSHHRDIAKTFVQKQALNANLAAFLNDVAAALEKNPELPNLLLDPYFTKAIAERHTALRRVIQTATTLGIPCPGLSASLAYYDSYRTARLPANLIQAQRDYFGAHTYHRLDQPGTFHTNWAVS